MDKKDVSEMIQKAIEDLARKTNEAKQAIAPFLKLMSRFHKYSLHNQILIWLQRPEATRVAGFRTWQKMNRFVKKGEKGIKIFAPVSYLTCPECGSRKGKEAVCPICGAEKTGSVYFKVVTVFDIEQTDGDELPKLDTVAKEDIEEDLYDALVETVEKDGIEVMTKAIPGTVQGYSSAGHKIVLQEGLSLAARFSVLVHEYAHELVHWREQEASSEKKSRQLEEVEAEGIAYVVCTRFGLHPGSDKYLEVYKADAEAIMDAFESISKYSAIIIGNLERTLERVPQKMAA